MSIPVIVERTAGSSPPFRARLASVFYWRKTGPEADSPEAWKTEAMFWLLVAVMGQWLFVSHVVPWQTI